MAARMGDLIVFGDGAADFSDPGYLRHCARPDCTGRFNIGEAYSGLISLPGWVQLTRVVHGYLCPAHAHAVTSGAHLPRWLNPAAARRVCAASAAPAAGSGSRRPPRHKASTSRRGSGTWPRPSRARSARPAPARLRRRPRRKRP